MGLKKEPVFPNSEIAQSRVSPAIHALIIQIGSLFFCLIISLFLRTIFSSPPTILFYVFLQAAVAASFSFLRGMDWWWHIIQFVFPILVLIFLFAEIPSIYYFIIFIVLAMLYWSTFATQVPYFPSKASLVPALLSILPPHKSLCFVDIGSGLGGLLIRLSHIRDESLFFGLEIAPLPWLISYFRGRICRSQAHFILGNYESLNFGDFDVVFAYLSPAVMPAIWQKALSEMKEGSLLLSYEFIIPDVMPDLRINIIPDDPILYVWRI